MIRDVPSANAPSSTARCEIDFSPGVWTVPTQATPPSTTKMRGALNGRRPVSRELLDPAAVALLLDRRRPGAPPTDASTTRISTPRSPSVECAISMS